jgi:hypothetical protein
MRDGDRRPAVWSGAELACGSSVAQTSSPTPAASARDRLEELASTIRAAAGTEIVVPADVTQQRQAPNAVEHRADYDQHQRLAWS